MPQKAAFTPKRKQELIDKLRETTEAVFSARGFIRYHLCKTEELYKEVDDLLKRMAAFERKAKRELDLPDAIEKPGYAGSYVAGRIR